MKRLKWVWPVCTNMAGGYERHLDEFGTCFDSSHSGIEMMRFEFKDERTGCYHFEEVPACAECFGLK